MLRAVSSPLNTGTASAVVRTVVADIIASIGPIGAGARLLQSCLVLSFDNGIGTVKIPGIAVSANKAAFIAEGAIWSRLRRRSSRTSWRASSLSRLR
jgi:hypothetical protein